MRRRGFAPQGFHPGLARLMYLVARCGAVVHGACIQRDVRPLRPVALVQPHSSAALVRLMPDTFVAGGGAAQACIMVASSACEPQELPSGQGGRALCVRPARATLEAGTHRSASQSNNPPSTFEP